MIEGVTARAELKKCDKKPRDPDISELRGFLSFVKSLLFSEYLLQFSPYSCHFSFLPLL
ncbi:hypothetical protein HMPREF1145_1121 [Oribacterium parvum ACB8]|nr:hypothetical protein HMPREF1145_1121 [Oribacterium parvum ACB8]